MKLALHIGTPKTGTTTLQRWFAANRVALRDQGVCYPVSPGAENHRKLSIYARDTDRPDGGFARAGVDSADAHAAFRAQFEADLAREVEANRDARVWLISNEHLHSKIVSEAMAQRVRVALSAFDEVTVYLHLRPQVDLLVSNASQRARMGREVSHAALTRPSVGPNSAYFNYDRSVRLWEAAFGADNLRLVPFRRIPDITRHLIGELGIDTAPLTPVERANEALDWRAIALANVVNRVLALDGAADPPQFFLDEMPAVERLQIGRATAEEIQQRFARSNAALARRRKDIRLSDLEPDWSAYDAPANLPLVEAPCVFADQLGWLIERFDREVATERFRRHLAEARLAILQGRDDDARRAEAAAERAARRLTAGQRVAAGGQDGVATAVSGDAGSDPEETPQTGAE
jgi:hypothetical protein